MTDAGYCSATIFGERVHSWSCPRKAVVQRDGKGWCKQHDPLAVKARRDKSHAAYVAEQRADESINREGTAIAKRLGCGDTHYQVRHRGRSGYTRHLVISFADAERFISLLQEKKAKAS